MLLLHHVCIQDQLQEKYILFSIKMCATLLSLNTELKKIHQQKKKYILIISHTRTHMHAQLSEGTSIFSKLLHINKSV